MKLFSVKNRERLGKVETVILPLFAFAVLLAIWHAGVIISETDIFPTPWQVVEGMKELSEKGVLFKYIGDSLMRVAFGYSLAGVLGLPVGLMMGWFPPMQALLNSVFQMMRPISPLAWIPLTIVVIGVNNTAPIFLVFLSSFFPIVISATT